MSLAELHEGVLAPRQTTRPSDRLKILLVADSLDAGGAERHVVGLGASLTRAGHSVTIACSTGGVLVEVARQHGVEVRPLLAARAKREVSLPFAQRLSRLIRCADFDLVHAHMYASAAAAMLATLGCSVPLVVTEHSEASWRRPSARLFSRLIYQRARHIIAVSRGIRQRLIQVDDVDHSRVTVILNALPAFAEPRGAGETVLPAMLRGRPLVGLAARLQPEKGVRFLLQAAAHAELSDAALVIIGDGPDRTLLESLAARLGLAQRCFFLGFRLDARTVIAQLDILVVPSLSEGTPLVVLEAMQAGVPIVASAVGGIPEQIRDGCEGVLVPPADSLALADALGQLLRDPLRARRLGQNGKRRVADSFSPDAMLRATQAVYGAVIHSSRHVG